MVVFPCIHHIFHTHDIYTLSFHFQPFFPMATPCHSTTLSFLKHYIFNFFTYLMSFNQFALISPSFLCSPLVFLKELTSSAWILHLAVAMSLKICSKNSVQRNSSLTKKTLCTCCSGDLHLFLFFKHIVTTISFFALYSCCFKFTGGLRSFWFCPHTPTLGFSILSILYFAFMYFLVLFVDAFVLNTLSHTTGIFNIETSVSAFFFYSQKYPYSK